MLFFSSSFSRQSKSRNDASRGPKVDRSVRAGEQVYPSMGYRRRLYIALYSPYSTISTFENHAKQSNQLVSDSIVKYILMIMVAILPEVLSARRNRRPKDEITLGRNTNKHPLA